MSQVNDSDIAIEIKDVHKEFILQQNKSATLKQAVINIVNKDSKTVYKVLDGVSFNIKKGDFIGIIGRNGSGKSTLLKLIAGVYTPTKGNIYVHGGLTPFIELGVGFNPELSGRDNVYLNGALLGFTRKQMASMYDEIVDFAEIGPFMDQKLKNYSSGMQVRLAFSIAINAKNDILMFDEVLAVGDEAFQQKCIGVFEKYKANGQTVVLVTHSMGTVKEFCNKAVLIDSGKITKIGNPRDVADEYSRLNQEVIDYSNEKKNDLLIKNQDISQHIIVKMFKHGDKLSNSFVINDGVKLELSWVEKMSDEIMILDLYKSSGECVTSFTCDSIKDAIINKHTRNAAMTTNLNLAQGNYYFIASLLSRDLKQKLSVLSPAYEFMITNDWSKSEYIFNGLTGLRHKWLKK